MIPLPTDALVAHSWGWDELIFFGIPIVLALVGIRWVERRAGQRYAETHGEAAGQEGADRTAPASVPSPGDGEEDKLSLHDDLE